MIMKFQRNYVLSSLKICEIKCFELLFVLFNTWNYVYLVGKYKIDLESKIQRSLAILGV